MTSPPAGVCGTAAQGIGAVTYDLRVTSIDGSTPEPFNVPEAVIDSLQASVIQNPLLAETDIILLPEFSYSMRDKPAQLVDHGAAATPRYEIINDNTVVTKVRRLQQLAAEYRLVIAVPLAEKVIYADESNAPLPVLWNSTFVIEKNGFIQHVRRKNYDMQGRTSVKVKAQIMMDRFNSFELLSFVTRTGKAFTSVIVVCAESDDSELVGRMQIGSGQGPWHADLLLYPQGGITYLQGDEIMKRLQYFDHLLWPETLEIQKLVGLFAPYVDHVVYAGVAIPPKHSQGIYTMDGKPLPYMFSDRMDQGGYVYARVNVQTP